MNDYKILLHRGHYPFPDLISSHMERLEKDYYQMIDVDCAFLTEYSRSKYKRMRLDIATARMFPMPMNYERIMPCLRMMLWITAFDDQYEYCSFEELDMLRQRVLTVLMGIECTPADPLDHLVAKMRDEFSAFMPQAWMERFARVFNDYIQYGMLEEIPFKAVKTSPPFALFLVFREYCIGMRPFIPFAEVQMDFVLPREIDDHPLIARFKSLTARIIAWQNDLRSWPKEIGRESEVNNAIFVLQRERNWTFEEANAEVYQMHERALAEFVELRTTLPNFGKYHDKVREYIDLSGIMIQGLNTWYDETDRYLAESKGYPEPEYKKGASNAVKD